MTQKVTNDISISVESFYQPERSKPIEGNFFFAYRITIENRGEFPIQVLKRKWHISDSAVEKREVAGDGVIGLQPVIDPGDRFQYVSGVPLHSELGKMHGTYEVKNMSTRKHFKVVVPEFRLIAPQKLN